MPLLAGALVSNSEPFKPNPGYFRCFRSVGKSVPEFRKPRVSGSNSEPPEPLGTTQNGSEATLPKVIPACVQPLHTTTSHVPFTLLPVKLSSSLFLAHIYTSSTQSFSSVVLPPSGSWLSLGITAPYLVFVSWCCQCDSGDMRGKIAPELRSDTTWNMCKIHTTPANASEEETSQQKLEKTCQQ